jgi:hypothetical protein
MSMLETIIAAVELALAAAGVSPKRAPRWRRA